MKTISVNPEAQSYELSINLPFVNTVYGSNPYANDARDIIDAFKTILLNAIETRMNACYNGLQNHLKDIIFSDQFCIVYRRSNGTVHSFNIKSYQAMEKCHKVLLTMDANKICHDLKENPQWAEQLCKALYWVKPEDKNGQCFGDLISCLMELAMFGKRA